VAAAVARVDVAAQGRGAADLDGAQNPQRAAVQRAGVILPVCLTVAVQNVGQFQGGFGHRGRAQGAGTPRSRRSNGLAAAHTVVVATCR